MIATAALAEALRSLDGPRVIDMLRCGADPNVATAMGGTALMFLSSWGDSSAIAELLETDVDVDAVDREGWSSLMFAAYRGDVDAVAQLMGAGASEELVNASGHRARDIAEEQGFPAISRLIDSYARRSARRRVTAARRYRHLSTETCVC